ncbi:helix-turn-helix domain-containing protein [Nonlabens xiamenensis]|uniref:helix-turn-helix domain-containing protein n=1 Tax=Nonlabens xiamenensis TaxID=2341043 RepID=UPI001980798A
MRKTIRFENRSYWVDGLDLWAYCCGHQLQTGGSGVRIKKGFTQEELANECDFEISQISRIERGVSNSSISTINKIASCLGISLSELFSFQK